MKELLYKLWFRKQSIIEDYNIFKLIIKIIVIFISIFCTVCIYFLTRYNNDILSFIMLNMFSFLFTLYNLPTINKELQTKKSTAFIQLKESSVYWVFTYLKENIIIIPWLVSIIICLTINISIDIKKSIILVSVLLIQILVCLLSTVSFKVKVLFIFYFFTITCLVNTNKYWSLLAVDIITLLTINIFLPKIFKGKYFVSQYINPNGSTIHNTFLGYLFKYLLRIKKKDYIDIIFSSFLAIMLFRLTKSLKIVEIYYILFYFAKLQLQIETNQSAFNILYTYNIFFTVRKSSYWQRLLYSLEFKHFILENISVILFTGYALFSSGIYPIGYFISTFLLMLLYTNKTLFIFYRKINKKQLYKGIFVNLILFYLILAIINIDLIQINRALYFILSWLITGICFAIPFEKILAINLLGDKTYEYNSH